MENRGRSKRFLREVHELATEKGLTDSHAIRAALSYSPSIDYELWCSLVSAQGSDWGGFQNRAVHHLPRFGG